MQGSGPRTRNTLPASAARKRDGTVSRFLASSECSKVPWKAKAHGGGEGSSVDPGRRSGRSPATRDRLREWNVPHTVPLCNTIIDFCPTRLESGHLPDPKVARLQVFQRWAAVGDRPAISAEPVAVLRPARGLAGLPT